MLTVERYAAIDIGSNAVRLLIADAVGGDGEAESTVLKYETMVRMPVRLGAAVFNRGGGSGGGAVGGAIDARTAAALAATVAGYAQLIAAVEVRASRCVATSALREAANREEVCALVRERTGVQVEVISGSEEARLIGFDRHDYRGRVLFIDVGGGSTDIALVEDSELREAKSFAVGTVRAREGREAEAKRMREWLRSVAEKKPRIAASGGGIRKIARMTTSGGKTTTRTAMAALQAKLAKLSPYERIVNCELRPDRADTIEAALEIYQDILAATAQEKLQVRQRGLADGVVRDLYGRHTGAVVKVAGPD